MITLTNSGELRRTSASRMAYSPPGSPMGERLADEEDALRVAFESWPKGVNVSQTSRTTITKRLEEGAFEKDPNYYINYWLDKGWVTE